MNRRRNCSSGFRRRRRRLVAEGKIKKTKPLEPITEEQEPFELPQRWGWVRLGDVSLKITDGEHISPNKTSFGMPLLTAKDVIDDGVSIDSTQYVSLEDGHRFRSRCDPERGDILICSRGTIGRCAAVEVDDIFCLMGSVILIKTSSNLFYRYIVRYLQSDIAQKWMRGASSATAVSALYLKDVTKCLVPLPSIAEQHRIVAKVNELMALCDQLEAAKTEREQSRDRLVAASLHQLQDSNGFTPRYQGAKKDKKAKQENLGTLAPWRESVFLQPPPSSDYPPGTHQATAPDHSQPRRARQTRSPRPQRRTCVGIAQTDSGGEVPNGEAGGTEVA